MLRCEIPLQYPPLKLDKKKMPKGKSTRPKSSWKRATSRVIPGCLFAFSLLTRAPTLLRLLIRCRDHPHNAVEAQAPDVYSFGIMLFVIDVASHAGYMLTTTDKTQNRQFYAAANASAYLSLAWMLGAMVSSFWRSQLFWLAFVFHAVAALTLPVVVSAWRHRGAVVAMPWRAWKRTAGNLRPIADVGGGA